MKLNYLSCMECLIENGYPSFKFHSLELNENNLYTFTCDQNHTTQTCLQNPRFEILFDIGVKALQEGFQDAAVSRFAAALENFYEYCIKVWLYANELKTPEIDSLWNDIKLSERRLGAFYALFSIDKHRYNYLTNINLSIQKWAKFRNDVIHNGYLPSYNESFQKAEEIYLFIRKIMTHFKNNYSKEIIQITEQYLLNIPAQAARVSTLHHTTILNIADTHCRDDISFQDAINMNESNNSISSRL